MTGDDLESFERRAVEIDTAAGALLDDVAAVTDHRVGLQAAASVEQKLRLRSRIAADLRREHLDAVAVEEEMDLAGLAELAGGVTRQRASQLRKAARDRRAEISTGESA